ncbi:MAG: export transporter periplasmic protein LptC [Bacteroidota bacterium]
MAPLLAQAQKPVVIEAAPTVDTFRLIEIVRGNSLRLKQIDSFTSLQTIAGDVELREGLTIFQCDSATINKVTNVVEAFGNIHINQNDSIHTYSQYLKYVGADQMAYLKKDVRLTDKKGTLYTQELEYDMKTNIGKYFNGGRVVNGKTTLTSKEGIYFADTRDVFFKRDVHLTDPKYRISSDSLRYNTEFQQVEFITDTYIKTKEGSEIFTRTGNYDLKNGKAFFGNRTVFKDSSGTTYTADNSAIDEASGSAQLEGNAVIRDSVNGYMITGNQVFLNRKTNSFLATRKPVLIFKGDGNDSTFIAADTLYSGIITRDSLGKMQQKVTDTLKTETVVSGDSVLHRVDSTVSVTTGIANSINTTNDSVKTTTTKVVKDSMAIRADTADIRFFQAFRNVRIFNDSLQAVCDSLYYSSLDSVFRMYRDPLVFSKASQIMGDTIHLFTKNKKADRIYVFDKGMIINKLNHQMFNQMGGRTLNGYFKDGELDYMRIKGFPAESVFYPMDDDSAITGMNRCHGDVIDIYFENRTVKKVKFINEVDGILFPISQIPPDQKELKGFIWLDKRRPKNKLELFE